METEPSACQTKSLIDALRHPGVFDHAAADVQLIETHISWVLLAGDYAYKIKKPVALPFADFSTLQARRLYCTDEVRLNRRLAPSVYVGVVAITSGDDGPVVDGEDQGEVLEYAVKMQRFEQAAVFDQLLTRNRCLSR